MLHTITTLLALASPAKVHKLPAITIAARVQCAPEAPRFDIRDPFTGRKLIYCYSK